MALSNKERVKRSLDALLPEMKKYVEQELRNVYADRWASYLAPGDGNIDVQRLCSTVIENWDDVFQNALPRDLKNTVYDIRKWRGHEAHQNPFSLNDALAALISVEKFLETIGSPLAEQVEKIKRVVMRESFDTGAKAEQKKAVQASLNIQVQGLRPWREVMLPHEDVAKGEYQQAEFMADLWQVYTGQGTPEYRDPKAFFARTFLTEGLRELLVNAVERLSGQGGDPVIELQINFGGGKTHSMLALYHLFAREAQVSELAGIEEVLKAVGVQKLPAVRRAVIVGTDLRPGSPTEHDDGIVTKTLWGEIAWQLAGREGYEIVRQTDENATNPGDLMDKLFALAGPSLILIDEWLRYASQLFERENMLPAGDFDTQFTFAQTLCEAARRAENVLVCVSLPISERGGVISGQVGGQAGRFALDRLQDAVGRTNRVWRPATTDESFEIVRRRLFQPIEGDKIAARDASVNEFLAFYRAHPNDFPPECRESGYQRRMQAAYPIHPELFDRLYEDWSTLERFQRTRGVLRLMAQVIRSLHENNDAGALVLPASVPLSDAKVQSEVTYYLPESWTAVVDKDVDGPGSVPLQLDAGNMPSYGRYSACRRVARTVFMGSAPLKDAANRGIGERRIKLGSVQPGEQIPTFGDALNKLYEGTTYLYRDSNRYWYHTQATVSREARDRAERVPADEVNAELAKRLRDCTKGHRRGEFGGIHVSASSGDVPDDRELRLAILSSDSRHKQGKMDSDALKAADAVMKFRGSAPRANRNRLIFLAPDSGRFQELETLVKQYIAWKSIVEDNKKKQIDLDNSNEALAAESELKSGLAVDVKLGEVYCHVLVPFQPNSRADLQWEAVTVRGKPEDLTATIVKKLETEQQLVRKLGGSVLKREIDSVPLWRDDERVAVAQLLEDFAEHTYLPRVIDEDKLYDSIRECLNPNSLFAEGGLGYADSYDPETGTYERPRIGAVIDPSKRPTGVLLPLAFAQKLIEEELAKNPPADSTGVAANGTPSPGQPLDPQGARTFMGAGASASTGATQVRTAPRRFHGTIRIDQAEFRERAGDVSREVAAQLAKVVGSNVEIIVEVVAEAEIGFSEDVLRTVSENCRTLKFESFEFEED